MCASRSRNSPGQSAMSAFGPKQTWAIAPHMSAFRRKADMAIVGQNAFLPSHRKSLVTTSERNESVGWPFLCYEQVCWARWFHAAWPRVRRAS